MLVSGVQQSDTVICTQLSIDTVTYTHVSILFQILFSFGVLQGIEQNSLCYIVDPCWLSILNIVVCICQSQMPNLPLPYPSPHGSFSMVSLTLKSLCSLLYSIPFPKLWREEQ